MLATGQIQHFCEHVAPAGLSLVKWLVAERTPSETFTSSITLHGDIPFGLPTQIMACDSLYLRPSLQGGTLRFASIMGGFRFAYERHPDRARQRGPSMMIVLPVPETLLQVLEREGELLELREACTTIVD